MSKTRSYCFTLNNYSEDDVKLLQAIDVKYIVFGKEVGESGTPHLQGYFYLSSPCVFAKAFSLLPPRCHLEAAKADGPANRRYCTKGGDFFEKGVCPGDKKANLIGSEVWDAAREAAKNGDFDAIPSSLYCRYLTNFEKIRVRYQQEVDRPVPLDALDNWWFCGASGTGKSRTAFGDNPGYYDKPCNKWWDGYNGQQVVVIDDFDPSHAVLAHYLKRWGDYSPFSAETKGGSIFIRPKKIIVTSQYSIAECFADPAHCDAISRRFRVRRF